jgi:hypothetical protein
MVSLAKIVKILTEITMDRLQFSEAFRHPLRTRPLRTALIG